MRILFSICLIFAISLVIANFAVASMGPPSPVCEIVGIIIDTSSENNADIKIVSIGKMLDSGDEQSYSNFNCRTYLNRLMADVTIRSENNHRQGQTIKGEISYFIDEFSPQGAFILENVKIVTNPQESETNYVVYNQQVAYVYFLVPIILIMLLFLLYFFTKPG